MSARTRKLTVNLNALNSEEIDHVIRIFGELLFQIGVRDEYIVPFVLFVRYLTELGEIRASSSRAACCKARATLQTLLRTLQSLDFTANDILINSNNNNNNNDSTQRINENEVDADQADDDDQPRRPQ